jgi:hypothetical protein
LSETVRNWLVSSLKTFHSHLIFHLQLLPLPAIPQSFFCQFDLLQQIAGIAIGGELFQQFATEGFGQQGLWQLLCFCFW